jgi:hypothetical protein
MAMPQSSTGPTTPIANPAGAARLFGVFLGFSGLLLGLSCSDPHAPPGLPGARITGIQLKIRDPATGSPGIAVAWTYPEDAQATYFEVYSSPDKDSLEFPVLSIPSAEPMEAILPLPDSSRPFTRYFAVRAVYIEPTGQRSAGDSLIVDSLTVSASLNILHPYPGSRLGGRTLRMEAQTNSDNGVILRISLFEKPSQTWVAVADTCLPLGKCQTPIFGPSLQSDSLVLEARRDGDTTEALFCIVGTESFQGELTGLVQSLSCSRFFRAGP